MWTTGGTDFLRWHSMAGGSNETALAGALAIALATSSTKGWKVGLAVVGVALIGGAAGITAAVAALTALLYSQIAPRTAGRRANPLALIGTVWVLLLGAVMIQYMRADLTETLDAHLFQASKFRETLRSSDPLLGTGWSAVDRAAFFNSDVLGLHNVYLDVISFLGAVGFALFVGLLVVIWRRGDIATRTLLVAWMVWVNTSGAFPGSAWGTLGMIAAAAATTLRMSEKVAEQGDVDDLRGASGRGVDAELDHAARRR